MCRSLTPRSTRSGMVAGSMRKFCIFGFLLGLALSGALIVESHLTGNTIPGTGDFSRYVRFVWPSAAAFAAPDPKFSDGVILILRLVSIGANGVFYALLGLIAYFGDRLVEKIVDAISARQTHSKKA